MGRGVEARHPENGRSVKQAFVAPTFSPLPTRGARGPGGSWSRKAALLGRVTDHHTFLLQELLSYIEFLDDQIAVFEAHTRPLASSADEKAGSALLSKELWDGSARPSEQK